MRAKRLPTTLALLLCMALLASATPGATFSKEGPTIEAATHVHTHADAMPMTDGGNGTAMNRTATTYDLNTQGLAEQVAETGTLTVTATNGDRMTLLLTEHQLMSEPLYYTMDENGTMTPHAFLGRTFHGTLATDPDSKASLLIAPEGLYGSVISKGHVWSFQPIPSQPSSSPDAITQEVSTYGDLEPSTTGEATDKAAVLLGHEPDVIEADVKDPEVPELSPEQTAAGSSGGSYSGSNSGSSGAKSGSSSAGSYRTNTGGGGGGGGTPNGQSGGPSGYTYCTGENNWCSFSGKKNVAYGVQGNFVFKYGMNTGGVQCSNAAFGGDPLPYYYKACYIQDAGYSQPTGFSYCAGEGGSCSISGAMDVAYGANGNYNYQYFVQGAGVNCNNSVFSDPLPYTVKACYKRPSGSAVGGAACGWTYTAYCSLHVQGFADNYYVAYASDWYNRIVGAYSQGFAMWRDETFILLDIRPPIGLNHNFAQTYDCGNGGPDGGMKVFGDGRESWRQGQKNNGQFHRFNAYGLFEAAWDMGGSIGGCGAARHLVSSRNNGGPGNNNAVHSINAKDWWTGQCCTFDNWAPNDNWQLGLAANHELTHNAGEENHPQNDYGSCGNYNIMWNGLEATFPCKAYFRVTSSKDRVKGFSYSFLSTT